MISMKFMKTMNACLVLADNLEVTPLPSGRALHSGGNREIGSKPIASNMMMVTVIINDW